MDSRIARTFAAALAVSAAACGSAFAADMARSRRAAPPPIVYAAPAALVDTTRVPACDDQAVFSEITTTFGRKEKDYWNSALFLTGFSEPREVAYRPWGASFQVRRFCSAHVYVSDGRRSTVYYSIAEDNGLFGIDWGVKSCVVGLDRNLAFAPNCKIGGALIRRLLLALSALAVTGFMAASPAAARGTPGDFDFYVLALSWSPSYCAGTRPDPAQCGRGRSFSFVVHGLWPQWRRGFPESCVPQPERIPDAVLSDMLDLMPSRGLVISEWRKHGSCSGLAPGAYFDLLRKARASVAIPRAFMAPAAAATTTPDAVAGAFRTANPALGRDMMTVTCGDHMLREVRICLDRSLGFIACPELARRTCRADTMLVPAVRGGADAMPQRPVGIAN